MNVVVCVKMAPDVADLEARADGTVSLDKAEWILGAYDLQAVEAAVRLPGVRRVPRGVLV